jgi:hypothetical protein
MSLVIVERRISDCTVIAKQIALFPFATASQRLRLFFLCLRLFRSVFQFVCIAILSPSRCHRSIINILQMLSIRRRPLRKHFSIAHNRCVIVLRPHCSRDALHSLCKLFAIALRSLCYRFAFALRLLRVRFATTFAFALNSLCNRFAIAL